MFKHILFATDFSAHAEIAKRFAMRLAQSDGKRLWALTVLEPEETFLDEADEPAGIDPQQWEDALQKTEQAAESESAHLLDMDIHEMEAEGIKVEKLVREGDPADEIIATAKEIDADLIVLGSHSRRNIWNIEMGNTAAKVAKKAPCPVLIVSHRPPHPALVHERILFATDFSPHAEEAFKVALSLAKETQGHLYLVSVIEPGEEIPMLPGFAVEAPDDEVVALEAELRANVEAKVRHNLEALAKEAKNADVETEILIRHGHIAKEIRKAAVDIEADLIVMGTHSRRSLWDKLLGNTAHNVAQHASCPVLLVSHTS